MNIYMWLILILISFLSVTFLVRLHQIRQFKEYRYFRFYGYVLVLWSVITILRDVVHEPFFIYHLGFLIYPTVFLIVSFLYMTIKIYIGGQVGKLFKLFVLVFFLIDLGVSLTNSWHQLVLQLAYTSSISTEAFSTAPIGVFFYIHTLVCYLLMFMGLYYLLKLFIVNFKRERDMYPFIMFFSSILLGIILNIIHVFFSPFVIDPTYIFMVVVGVIMLNIFRNRDLRLILHANGNKDILDHSREMYIISTHQGMVIDCSRNLKVKYKELISAGVTLKDLKDKIRETSILYINDRELVDEFDSTKRYYHVKEQRIKMPHFRYFGRLTLLYEETADIKLINEMDRIMSHDLMTGLYNRNYFENQIPILENTNNNFGVIIIDVDGLKLHNDYLGHKSGDELLINFSNMMLQICNENEELIPIRLGGDEFLLIHKHGDLELLEKIAEDLTKKGLIEDPIKSIYFSYGISIRDKNKNKFSTVLRDADANLYIMKEKKIDAKKVLEKQFKALEAKITKS